MHIFADSFGCTGRIVQYLVKPNIYLAILSEDAVAAPKLSAATQLFLQLQLSAMVVPAVKLFAASVGLTSKVIDG